MQRTTLITAICLAGLASPLWAQDDCQIQGDVVQLVVDNRLGGMDATLVRDATAQSLGAAQEKYIIVLPDIIAWVYSLPREHLTEDVAKAYAAACAAAQ